jgi:hypothetical protein
MFISGPQSPLAVLAEHFIKVFKVPYCVRVKIIPVSATAACYLKPTRVFNDDASKDIKRNIYDFSV